MCIRDSHWSETVDLSEINDISEGDDIYYFGEKRPIWKLAKELNEARRRVAMLEEKVLQVVNLLRSDEFPLPSMKCEYCITAQVHMAKAAGASEDEIKAAIFIAAEVARFSSLLYGNEFGMDNLKSILGIQPD